VHPLFLLVHDQVSSEAEAGAGVLLISALHSEKTEEKAGSKRNRKVQV
jgi:hypothetical protein